jgi:hypothetical protein
MLEGGECAGIGNGGDGVNSTLAFAKVAGSVQSWVHFGHVHAPQAVLPHLNCSRFANCWVRGRPLVPDSSLASTRLDAASAALAQLAVVVMSCREPLSHPVSVQSSWTINTIFSI